MGAAVTQGEESGAASSSTAPPSPIAPDVRPPAPGPAPLRLDHLLLLDSAGNDPLEIEALVFDDSGIGVIRRRGESPRLLPWSDVSAHVVERWSGGIVPEWWVDPELNRASDGAGLSPVITDPDATSRAMPHIEPGALIGVKTPTRTYRFLVPGADSKALSGRLAAFAVRHQGPAGMSSVTTAIGAGGRAERSPRSPGSAPDEQRSGWSRVQPILVVLLILFIAAAVTLILLQSAGTIHLPFLGGADSDTVTPLRSR